MADMGLVVFQFKDLYFRITRQNKQDIDLLLNKILNFFYIKSI